MTGNHLAQKMISLAGKMSKIKVTIAKKMMTLALPKL